MFRNPVGEFRLSSGKASGPPYRPAVEALEERVLLNTDMPAPVTSTEPADLAFQITKAAASLALRLQNSHLSRAGLGNLLVTEMQLRAVIAQLEQSNPATGENSLEVATGLFHAVDQVLIKEVTALANGHRPSEGVRTEAIGLASFVQHVDLGGNAP